MVVDVFEVSTELASHHYWNSLPESPYKRPYTLEESASDRAREEGGEEGWEGEHKNRNIKRRAKHDIRDHCQTLIFSFLYIPDSRYL